MNDWDRLRRIAETQKKLYPPGTRIELIHMGDDDPHPIPDGTKGTVTAVDDIGTVFCRFDNGRSLGLAYGADSSRRNWLKKQRKIRITAWTRTPVPS